MKSMIVFMAIFALASASSVKLEKTESVVEESGKLFVATNNMGSFLALNSTVLFLGVGALIIGAGVILGTQLTGGNIPFRSLRRAYEKYAYEPSHEYSYYGDQNEYETRYKRSAFDGNVTFSILSLQIDVLIFAFLRKELDQQLL